MWSLPAEVPCVGGICENGECISPYEKCKSGFCDPDDSVITPAHDPNRKLGPQGNIVAGQKLDYRVEYENEGEGIAFGVYFTDTLDEDLDDSTLEIGPVIDVDTGTQIAPPGRYDPVMRTITWFVGQVDPNQGGYADISVNVKADATQGTDIINFATVYFPSVPEATRTNAIVSTVNEITLTVTANILNQDVQYSDPIDEVVFSATGITGDEIQATVSYSTDGGITFKTHFTTPPMLVLPDDNTIIGGLSLSGDVVQIGNGTWTLAGVADLAPGTYIIRLTARDGDGASAYVDTTINVLQEDAFATYVGDENISTPSEKDSITTVELQAVIVDMTTVDPASDSDAGNITKALVSFVNRNNGSIIAENVPVVLLDPEDITTGVAGYKWAVDIGSQDSASFIFGIIVNGYYTRDNSDDNTIVTVSRIPELIWQGRISSSEDDGYAFENEFQNLAFDFLKVGPSNFYPLPYYVSGMVFREVNVPQGAQIVSARLKICSHNAHLTDDVFGTIEAEDSDSAVAFSIFSSVNDRPKTSASVDWDLIESWSPNTWYESPDIAEVIQEVINRGGWSKGNSLALLYSTRTRDGGYRQFSSYDRGIDYAPKLEITYEP